LNRAPSARTVYLRLLRYVTPYWRLFALAIAAMVVLAATEPAIPALLKPTLDGSFVDKDLDAVGLMALALVGVFLIRGLASFGSAVALSWVATRLVMDLREELFAKLSTLPTRYYDHTNSGRLISKVTFDATQVTEAATQVLMVLVRDSLALAGLLAWMLYLEWQLTLVTFATAPFVLLVIRYFSGRLRRMSRRLQEGMADITQVVEEATKGQKIVRTFGTREFENRRFHKVANAVRHFQMKFAIASAASIPLTQFLTSIGLGVILYVAGHKSAAGEISVGSFVSFFMAMAMLFAPLKRLTGVNSRLQQGIAAAISVFSMLDEASEPDTGTRTLDRAQGRLELRGVGFRYQEQADWALKDVDLVAKPGRTLALVGPSGAGKSTLISLIPRFYEIQQGTILIDGIDIRELTLASLRRQIALVSQDIVLFNDTIAANIAYGRGAGAEPERVAAAARAAHAMEFIEGLPDGLGTSIGERGVRLSGGQRQRLAIARAFFKDAPILILDEATSALDTQSERHIQSALDTLRHGRTTILIAHRLSTIEKADQIAVIAGGRVADLGSHAELLERNALYAGLYRFQFVRHERTPASGSGVV